MTLLSAVLSLALTGSVLTAPAPAPAAPRLAEQTGSGGAVSSVDPEASAVGVEVLRRGGNAVDAAVATAAALGVTDPFSTGIAGAGFFVHYQAATGRVSTIDGRETAPSAAHEQLFVENGAAIPFDEASTSGLSVGVPGNPATWRRALARWGTLSLGQALAPAETIARRGFVVDETFHRQITNNAELADTYREQARTNLASLYGGALGRDVVRTVRRPPVVPGSTRNVRPGRMTIADLAGYRVTKPAPARTRYRGPDVYTAAAPAGGLCTGEALNILETADRAKASQTEYLHRFMEATKLAFADRTRWIGDPSRAEVPARQLLSRRYADSRACLIRAGAALPAPTGAGHPRNPQPCAASGSPAKPGDEAERTTHLVVTDRWGNAVSRTSTIESEGGNGIGVPGRGLLLNNELTDFNFVPALPVGQDPNLPGAGKRRRSAMSPVIVLDRGRIVLAAGSPGGGTIITTVTQILAERYARGRTLLEAVAAPRVPQRNTAVATAEPAFLASSG